MRSTAGISNANAGKIFSGANSRSRSWSWGRVQTPEIYVWMENTWWRRMRIRLTLSGGSKKLHKKTLGFLPLDGCRLRYEFSIRHKNGWRSLSLCWWSYMRHRRRVKATAENTEMQRLRAKQSNPKVVEKLQKTRKQRGEYYQLSVGSCVGSAV